MVSGLLCRVNTEALCSERSVSHTGLVGRRSGYGRFGVSIGSSVLSPHSFQDPR